MQFNSFDQTHVTQFCLLHINAEPETSCDALKQVFKVSFAQLQTQDEAIFICTKKHGTVEIRQRGLGDYLTPSRIRIAPHRPDSTKKLHCYYWLMNPSFATLRHRDTIQSDQSNQSLPVDDGNTLLKNNNGCLAIDWNKGEIGSPTS